jgi:hypothetical protein
MSQEAIPASVLAFLTDHLQRQTNHLHTFFAEREAALLARIEDQIASSQASLALAIRPLLDAREVAMAAKLDAEAADLRSALATIATRITSFEERTSAIQAQLARYLAVDKYAVTRAAIADVLREASND